MIVTGSSSWVCNAAVCIGSKSISSVIGVVGGGIQMYQSTLGRTPVARSDLWDSNYDGNAVIDFRPIQSDRVVTKWIMIESPNGMGSGSDRFAARNYFTGDYTVTLTDITGLETMVSNTEQREDDRLVHSDIGHLHDQEPEFLGHNREVATSFTTGSNSAGYALDSITAYMQPGRTAATATILATIEEIVDTHTEDDNIDESDLITFPEDSVDITLTSATIVSTIAEPAVSIHSDNGGEPGDKLCDARRPRRLRYRTVPVHRGLARPALRRRLRRHHADRKHHVLDRVRLQRAAPVLVLPRRPSHHHQRGPRQQRRLEHRRQRPDEALHQYRDRRLGRIFLPTRRRRSRHPQLAPLLHRSQSHGPHTPAENPSALRRCILPGHHRGSKERHLQRQRS